MVETKEYCVDIVFCIDVTGSMSPIIDKVKQCALDFYVDTKKELDAAGKTVSQLRVKVITFRDFGCDGAGAMDQSRFFILDDEKADFESYVAGITVSGGGDPPENALEAIVEAIRSDWTLEGLKRRQIIVVFTDAPALNLGERASAPNYPFEMPATLDDLELMWLGNEPYGATSYDPEAARLVLFAPNVEPWTTIVSRFDRKWYNEVDSGKGLKDIEMKQVIDLIVRSIAAVRQ